MAKSLVFVVVNSRDDYETRKSFYKNQGFNVKAARFFDNIKIDLQDHNGTEMIIEQFHAFLATKQD